ncbi:MAG: 3-hydroxyacyl-ACP dehydratase FabZ family protein [Myxococcota bacterium]|nr:3-hydroxyacyl-ACP dehydratase FabZ family protein [Myxococcota bacterium]
MQVDEIKKLLPHREPFLFVDEIVEIREEGLTARRTVRESEPQFEGHYPGRPIMPGVLLCESALQAGCLFLAVSSDGEGFKGTPVVTRMTDVKFRKMVVPGDTLDIDVTLEKSVMNVHFMRAKLLVGKSKVMTLSFAVTLAPEESNS